MSEIKTDAELLAKITVDPLLDWHDRGCVKRYGAIGDAKCQCELNRERSLQTDIL